MVPAVGGYGLSPKPIEVDELLKLMKRHFADNDPENMRYYYVVHDKLMDLLEK